PVQRIRYAENESNYCAKCQTDGKLLADRSLSRLMGGDWRETLEELEATEERGRAAAAPRPGSFAARAASFIPSRPPAPEAAAPPPPERTGTKRAERASAKR